MNFLHHSYEHHSRTADLLAHREYFMSIWLEADLLRLDFEDYSDMPVIELPNDEMEQAA